MPSIEDLEVELKRIQEELTMMKKDDFIRTMTFAGYQTQLFSDHSGHYSLTKQEKTNASTHYDLQAIIKKAQTIGYRPYEFGSWYGQLYVYFEKECKNK